MQHQHIKYPKIGQFSQAVRNVITRSSYIGSDERGEPMYDRGRPRPKLEFIGSVKLHGTNAAIVVTPFGEVYAQSRNRVLGDGTDGNDNSGFAAWALDYIGSAFWRELAWKLFPHGGENRVIYGEWAGKGIQSGAAICDVDAAFFVFGLRIESPYETDVPLTRWVPIHDLGGLDEDERRVFSIHDPRFPTYRMTIDFEFPESAQNKLAALTQAVEDECPVAKVLGVSGVGEGIVWKCDDPGYQGGSFMFKVKGQKHSSSKVRKLARVDAERVGSVVEFVESTVTENRLRQGLAYLEEMSKPLSRSSTGDYLGWVVNDILAEEADRMKASGLTRKDVSKSCATRAREWFFREIDRIEAPISLAA